MTEGKKIIITGASGYLGPYLCKSLSENRDNEITVIYNSHEITFSGVKPLRCDLTQTEQLEKIFREIRPDIVYHLASVTPTRINKQSNDFIRDFNCGVTEKISRLCSEMNSLLIYTSTDLVYDEGENITEESRLNPLTIYAKTKLEGEEAVKSFSEKFIIFRTSLIYGFTISSYTSFYDIAYEKLKNGEKVNAFYDQFRNPIYTEDAAHILCEIPKLYKANEVINLCGDEYLSRYEMCLIMADVFRFRKELVIKSTCNEFTEYPMVKKLRLNNNKLKSYGLRVNSYKENLKRSFKFITSSG
ncbi:MAG: SDR family oxidoreductase [Ignavibacteria bacterium]|nr:SDR family oxidoreductase [Ignavibacteria bacterium]